MIQNKMNRQKFHLRNRKRKYQGRHIYSIFPFTFFYLIMSKNNPMGFVEVSINSERLSDFLSNIQKTIKQQQTRIDEMNKRLITKITQVNDNTQKLMTDIKNNEKDIKQIIISEVLLQKEQLKKNNQKTEILFETLHDQIKAINTQIIQDKKASEEVFQKAEYAFQQCKEIKVIKNTITDLQRQVDEVKSQKFKKNLEEYIEKAQQDKVGEICQDTFFKIIENDRVREIIQKKQYISKDNKNNKSVIGQKQVMFYASISDKLQKLEQKLMQNNTIELNNVLYPSKTANSFNSTASFNKSYSFSPDQLKELKEQFEQNTAIKGLSSKLQTIEQAMNKKMQELKFELTRNFEKNELFNEKISIMMKKIEKERSRINDLTVEVKKNSEKKIDQKILESFRYEIRQKSLDYQDNLDAKLNKELFEKEKTKINERIKIIHENLTEKTDKSQIKKAISFLESKIKQIILLVAGSYEEDREGSIKKTPFKCLSCDKDLDTKLQHLKEKYKDNMVVAQLEEGKITKRSESAAKLRCATSRLRKHIRMNSGAVTPVAHLQKQSFGFDCYG